MIRVKESLEFGLGRAGERVLARWLQEQGFAVVPTGFIEKCGAPLLEGMESNLILPDIQAFKAGAARWVEVKTKSKSVLYERTGNYRTGCGWRHWEHYLAVQETTSIPVWLAFLHIETHELWLQRASVLQPAVSRVPFHKRFGEEMAFFDWDLFEIYSITEQDVHVCQTYRKLIAERGPSGKWITTPPKTEDPRLF